MGLAGAGRPAAEDDEMDSPRDLNGIDVPKSLSPTKGGGVQDEAYDDCC
jgi:hypothetical protein